MKQHSWKRFVSLLLSLLLVLSILPTQVLTSYAAGKWISFTTDEIDEEAALNTKVTPHIVNTSKLANYSEDAGGYAGVSSHWCKSYIDNLIKKGVLRGVKVGESYYLPTSDPAVGGTNPDEPDFANDFDRKGSRCHYAGQPQRHVSTGAGKQGSAYQSWKAEGHSRPAALCVAGRLCGRRLKLCAEL